MPVITPRLNFTDSTATPGVGQAHSTIRVHANSMSPETFNEYERLFIEIASAVGNYDFRDILSSNATSISGALREVYVRYNDDLISLRSSKLDVLGGIISGDLSIQGSANIGQQLNVTGALLQMGSARFLTTTVFDGSVTFNAPINIGAALTIAFDASFGSNVTITNALTASSATFAGLVASGSCSTQALTVSGASSFRSATFAEQVTFNQPVIFNAMFTMNDHVAFANDVTFQTAISALGFVTFEKQVSFNDTFSSSVIGRSPFSVSSTVLVTNLNADKLDGFETSRVAAANTIPVYTSAGLLSGDIDGSSTSCSGLSAQATIAGSLAKDGNYSDVATLSWITETQTPPSVLLGSNNGSIIFPVDPSILHVAVAAACTGNSVTANRLATAVSINSVLFDGSSNITITSSAETLTGTFLSSTVIAAPSLVYVGTLGSTFAITGAATVGETLSVTGETTLKHTLTGMLVGRNGRVEVAVPYYDYLPPNEFIVSGSFTKITYNDYGLVVGGTNATTADIVDSSNRRYITDQQRALIENTSGINTGDQHNILGNAATASKLYSPVKINGVYFDGSKDITISGGGAGDVSSTGPFYADVAFSGLIKAIPYDDTHSQFVNAIANTDYVTPSFLSTALGNISSTFVLGSTSITTGYTYTSVSGLSSLTSTNIIVSSATALMVVCFDASKHIVSSTISTDKLGYLSDVTSNIQTQLDEKQASITNPITGNNAGTSGNVAIYTGVNAINPVAVKTGFNRAFETIATNIKMNGILQAVGSLDTIARGDHVHPTDTSRAASGATFFIGQTSIALGRASAVQTLAGVSIDGSANTLAVGGLASGSDTQMINGGYVNYSVLGGTGYVTDMPLGATNAWYHCIAHGDNTALSSGAKIIDCYPTGTPGILYRKMVVNGVSTGWVKIFDVNGKTNHESRLYRYDGETNYGYYICHSFTGGAMGWRITAKNDVTDEQANIHVVSVDRADYATSAGTVTSAAQPNITSVGSSLTASGGLYSLTTGEARVVVNHSPLNRDFYMYSNGSARGMYDSYAGPVFHRNWVDSVWTLDNNWTCTATFTAVTLNATSSRKLKENIVEYKESALDILNQTKVCLYNFKKIPNETRIGMIAEDVHDLISPTHESVDIGNTVALLIKSVQELMLRLDDIEARI